jgi:hypothetical protein
MDDPDPLMTYLPCASAWDSNIHSLSERKRSAMKEAFPDYPLLSSIRGPRSFSLPQQTYLVLSCSLELYRVEATRRFEQDHQEQEPEPMSRQAYADRLDASADALGYEKILKLFHQAQRHLVERSIEQLQTQIGSGNDLTC